MPTPAARSLLRWAPPLLGVLLIVLATLVQGIWSGRWSGTGEQAEPLATVLSDLPRRIGPWQAENLPTSERELRASGAVGHLARSYRNESTGEALSVFIVCGDHADISVHTPDRCYPAAGFRQVGGKQRIKLDDANAPAEFYRAQFESPERLERQRVFWTWGLDGRWQAPEVPRIAFAGEQVLLKMYLIEPVATASAASDKESACLEFARAALPVFSSAVFSQSH